MNSTPFTMNVSLQDKNSEWSKCDAENTVYNQRSSFGSAEEGLAIKRIKRRIKELEENSTTVVVNWSGSEPKISPAYVQFEDCEEQTLLYREKFQDCRFFVQAVKHKGHTEIKHYVFCTCRKKRVFDDTIAEYIATHPELSPFPTFTQKMDIIMDELSKVDIARRSTRSLGKLCADIMGENEICGLCLKNGHVFKDKPLTYMKDDNTPVYYGTLVPVIWNDKVWDLDNNVRGEDVTEYINKLKSWNPLLRLDPIITFGMTYSDAATAICKELRGNTPLTDKVPATYDSTGKRIV